MMSKSQDSDVEGNVIRAIDDEEGSARQSGKWPELTILYEQNNVRNIAHEIKFVRWILQRDW